MNSSIERNRSSKWQLNPLAEDKARFVLDIYSRFGSRPGDVLSARNFIPVSARKNINILDLQSGLDDAVRFGWLEETPTGSLRLTNLGYDHM